MLAHSKNFHQLIFTKISFNLTLTISFRKFSLKIKNILYYEPYVMNFHPGSMNYGHTYSYFKIDDNEVNKIGKWYCFNDSHISDVICPKSSKEVINVFYKIKII